MPGYADYYDARRRRSKARGGRGEDGDIIVTAITIQVIVCLVLILAFIVYKKADESGYKDFKDEYSSLIRDQDRNGEVVEMLSQVSNNVSEAVSSFERYIINALSGLGSGRGQEQSHSAREESLPEISVPGNAGGNETEEAGYGRYNYLSDGGLNKPLEDMGAGGWFPADAPAGNAALEAPEGSVFSPLTVSAKVKPPVTGLITSVFGYRYHPVTEAEDFHSGMDIASAEGTPILSALPGEVAEVGESWIYGNYIRIKHSEKLETFYAHCSEIVAGEGMMVKQGERIAKVGQTGVATGPHLHFSVIAEGLYTDPYWVLKDNIKILEE